MLASGQGCENYVFGGRPVTRLKALLKALSDEYLSDCAMTATGVASSRNVRSARRMRQSVR
jgi:hypothetical protein